MLSRCEGRRCGGVPKVLSDGNTSEWEYVSLGFFFVEFVSAHIAHIFEFLFPFQVQALLQKVHHFETEVAELEAELHTLHSQQTTSQVPLRRALRLVPSHGVHRPRLSGTAYSPTHAGATRRTRRADESPRVPVRCPRAGEPPGRADRHGGRRPPVPGAPRSVPWILHQPLLLDANKPTQLIIAIMGGLLGEAFPRGIVFPVSGQYSTTQVSEDQNIA